MCSEIPLFKANNVIIFQQVWKEIKNLKLCDIIHFFGQLRSSSIKQNRHFLRKKLVILFSYGFQMYI